MGGRNAGGGPRGRWGAGEALAARDREQANDPLLWRSQKIDRPAHVPDTRQNRNVRLNLDFAGAEGQPTQVVGV